MAKVKLKTFDFCDTLSVLLDIELKGQMIKKERERLKKTICVLLEKWKKATYNSDKIFSVPVPITCYLNVNIKPGSNFVFCDKKPVSLDIIETDMLIKILASLPGTFIAYREEQEKLLEKIKNSPV